MNSEKSTFYLVKVRTPSGNYDLTIEAKSLHRAACAGVFEALGIDIDSSTWTSRPNPAFSTHRLLTLQSGQGSVRVTAEMLN